MNKYHREILKANFQNGRLAKYFVRELKGFTHSAPIGKKWLFILGCYNSGTTLIHNLLARSSIIASLPGEGQFLTNQFLLPNLVGLRRRWVQDIEKFYLSENRQEPNPAKVKKQWASYFNDLERPVLMEKSPTDIARIKWYNKHFENPHFVGIVRNGYAVSEGIKRKANLSIEEAAIQWKKSNEIMLNDLKPIASKILIRYEDLTEDPQQTLNKIFDFLKIDNIIFSEQEVLNIHGFSSKIQNMNKRSFDILGKEEIQIIDSIASGLLTELNYSIN